MDKLLKALEKEKQDIRSADIVLNGEIHQIYYRTMSGQDHSRALELSKKTKTVQETDGSTTDLTYYDDDLLRAHIIYFQLLDKDGNRVFTNLPKIKWIQENIAYETSSYLAAVMGLKSVSDIIEEQQEALKKDEWLNAKAHLAFELHKSISEINDLPMEEIGTLLAYKINQNKELDDG